MIERVYPYRTAGLSLMDDGVQELPQDEADQIWDRLDEALVRRNFQLDNHTVVVEDGVAYFLTDGDVLRGHPARIYYQTYTGAYADGWNSLDMSEYTEAGIWGQINVWRYRTTEDGTDISLQMFPVRSPELGWIDMNNYKCREFARQKLKPQ